MQGGAGGTYGGGGGGSSKSGSGLIGAVSGSNAGTGAVRIMWGPNRSYPSTGVADA
jgi:hypothetical protein